MNNLPSRTPSATHSHMQPTLLSNPNDWPGAWVTSTDEKNLYMYRSTLVLESPGTEQDRSKPPKYAWTITNVETEAKRKSEFYLEYFGLDEEWARSPAREEVLSIDPKSIVTRGGFACVHQGDSDNVIDDPTPLHKGTGVPLTWTSYMLEEDKWRLPKVVPPWDGDFTSAPNIDAENYQVGNRIVVAVSGSCTNGEAGAHQRSASNG